jgi:hypothetical protein
MGAVLTLVLLFLGNPVEKLITRHAGNGRTDAERREAGRADDTSTLQREG